MLTPDKQLFRDTDDVWYRPIIEQILLHGWEPLTEHNTIDLTADTNQLMEFRFPGSTAVLEVTNPSGGPEETLHLTLRQPFDPSFSGQSPHRTREPFAWSLADAHEAVANQYQSRQTRVFRAPDIVMSADVPLSGSDGTIQETLLSLTLTAATVGNLHAGIHNVVDQYRSSEGVSTAETVANSLGFESL